MIPHLIHFAVMSIFSAIAITGAASIIRDLTRPLDHNHYLKD